MKTSPKYIFFTDFDGTITQSDSNDYLTDNLGFGQVLRKQANQDVLHDKTSFRHTFEDMMNSVRTPFDQCIATLLENIQLDVGFKQFFEWARQNNVPVVVLSSGMEPIIRALLTHLVGPEADEIQIVSNDVASRDGKSINEEAGWQIVFHDDRFVFPCPSPISQRCSWNVELTCLIQQPLRPRQVPRNRALRSASRLRAAHHVLRRRRRFGLVGREGDRPIVCKETPWYASLFPFPSKTQSTIYPRSLSIFPLPKHFPFSYNFSPPSRSNQPKS